MAIFRPLDAFGGNTFAARGSATLRELDADGLQEYRFDVALTLPALQTTFTVSRGSSFSASPQLPSLTARGFGGATGRCVLPSLTLSATATVPGWATADIALPALTVEAAGTVGVSCATAFSLPMLQVAARMGGYSIFTLPSLRVTGQVTTAERSSAALTLPSLRATGQVSVYSSAFHVALTLPALQVCPTARGATTLPSLVVTGRFLYAATYRGWVLNTRNGGVTSWSNVPFTGIAQHGSAVFMVGGGKLYQLGGDLDVAAPVTWSFETGLDDMDKPGVKRIPYLYLDGIIDGQVQITVLDDREREFMYEYDTAQRGAVHLPHRRKLGNGIRTRNVAFRIGSDSGAYIELDAIEPEATITQRSI